MASSTSIEIVGYSCHNVYSTGSATVTMSRNEILQWINQTVGTNYKKVEQLCDGVAYCKLMDITFPGCIVLKKVKMNTQHEIDYLHNLKVLQLSFKKVNSDKTVPMEKLSKGRFQDNLEFVQWFKKFFDANYGKHPSAITSLSSASSLNSVDDIKPTSTKGSMPKKTLATYPVHSTPIVASSKMGVVPPQPRRLSSLGASTSYESLTRQKSQANLLEKVAELKKKEQTALTERDYYYEKLRAIEVICQTRQEEDEGDELVRKILEVAWMQ